MLRGTRNRPCHKHTMKDSAPHGTMNSKGGTYTILLFVEHKGSDGPPSVSTGSGLPTNMNGGAAPAILILGTQNGASGHRHIEISGRVMGVELTGVVDGGTANQWRSLYPFPVRTIARPKRTDHLTQLRVQPHFHHQAPPLLRPSSQWRYKHTPLFVILTHMMSLIHQHISIYSSWFVICVVTAHGLCTRPALY